MAVGETIRVRAVEYLVIWDGSSPVSLLSDYPRPSTLAELVQEKRAKKVPAHRVERVRQWTARAK